MNDVVLEASALLALIRPSPVPSGSPRYWTARSSARSTWRRSSPGLPIGAFPARAIRRQLARLDLGVVPVDEDLAYAVGLLRPATRALGLLLGDRVCIALARRAGAVALTTDRVWARLEIGVAVELVRAG